MVPIQRPRNAEQRLQVRMNIGRRFKVHAAYNMRNALDRIIDDNGQMIARRRIFPNNHNIAPPGEPCLMVRCNKRFRIETRPR